MFNKKKNNKGFTLVELLVVIAIIGILSVVAVPALFKNIEKGKIADLEADISAIRSAALSYYADHSEYPDDIQDDLANELEGLSNPFNAEPYELEGDAPAPLKLIITQKTGSELSEDGFLKLRKDLGEDVVPFNNVETQHEQSSVQIADEEGSTELTPGTVYDPEQPIIINLINN